MVRSFLFSFLSRQAAFNEERFKERYPHFWLVLETPARKVLPPTTEVANTQAGVRPVTGDWPPPGDALCFELVVNPRESASFRVGRNNSNDIAILDESVSRDHCVVTCAVPPSWTISPLLSSETWVGGKSVGPGQLQRVEFEQPIRLGQAVVTLYDPGALLNRLRAHAAAQLA